MSSMDDRAARPARPNVPASFLALTTVGGLCLAAGAVGLASPGLAPQLASAPVAWSLVGVGVVMDLLAVGQLLSSRARARSR